MIAGAKELSGFIGSRGSRFKVWVQHSQSYAYAENKAYKALPETSIVCRKLKKNTVQCKIALLYMYRVMFAILLENSSIGARGVRRNLRGVCESSFLQSSRDSQG